MSAPAAITVNQTFLDAREDIAVEFSEATFNMVKYKYIHGPGIDEILAVKSGKKAVYKAFGEDFDSSFTLENRYRYTDREFVETGSHSSELYYYRARYYRPYLGRFVSKDPLGMVDGTNQFIYVQNNPVGKKDPNGHFSVNGCGCDQQDIEDQLRTACDKAAKNIRDPYMESCILYLCKFGKIDCHSDWFYCGNDQAASSLWFFGREVHLCNNRCQSEYGLTIIHEFAHMCGMWGENDDPDVPGGSCPSSHEERQRWGLN